MRGVGSVVDKVPPERIDQLRQKANQLLDELPQTAARGVETVFRGAKAGKQMLQRWSQRHLALVTPVINASGCLSDHRLHGVGLGEPLVELASGAIHSPLLRGEAAADRLQRRLGRCVGDHDWGILVATSLDAACLAIGLTRHNRPLYFHRAQSSRLASGTAIPDAFVPRDSIPAGEIAIHEVGSRDGITASDASGLSPHAILIAVDSGEVEPVWFAAGGRAADNDQLKVVLMTACGGIGGTRGEPTPPWLATIHPLPRLVADHLGRTDGVEHADLVITGGDGLLGGPPCGLIIGSRAEIENIAASAAWHALEADLVTRAMITLVLEGSLHANGPEHPVALAVTTSPDNLKHRAERISIRLAADESIASCQLTDAPARLTPTGSWGIASRQLRIRSHRKTAEAWVTELSTGVPAVLAQVIDDSLAIDLRWVRPADDSALVAALLGYASASDEQGPGKEGPGNAAQGNERAASESEPTDPPS